MAFQGLPAKRLTILKALSNLSRRKPRTWAAVGFPRNKRCSFVLVLERCFLRCSYACEYETLYPPHTW